MNKFEKVSQNEYNKAVESDCGARNGVLSCLYL